MELIFSSKALEYIPVEVVLQQLLFNHLLAVPPPASQYATHMCGILKGNGSEQHTCIASSPQFHKCVAH